MNDAMNVTSADADGTEQRPNFDPSVDLPPPPTPSPEPHMARVLRPRVLGVPILTLSLLAFASFVIFSNYLPTRMETIATERQIDAQQVHNAHLAQSIRAAEETRQLLETDRAANERILRDELHMTRKGEAVVR